MSKIKWYTLYFKIIINIHPVVIFVSKFSGNRFKRDRVGLDASVDDFNRTTKKKLTLQCK